MVILYVLLGNARSIQPNPFIEGANIAVNMMVPVLAGILFGRGQGLLVGFFGTLLNALSPAGNMFEILAIIPHSIMGFSAGYFKEKFPTPILACSLIIGHILNLSLFTIFQLLPLATFLSFQFWLGIGYEILTGVIAIMIIKAIYNLATEKE
tara:strand:- start:530 stop:985 length:456 start_codon:yes stop_codon:yes gene_type:complete